MEQYQHKKVAETPLMKQYNAIKEKYPDAILLFRVGDFYETFCEDAIKASRILNITLTQRANGKAASIELAGFPYHSINTYMPKLIQAGERVAICDQLENPKNVKGIVKRGVTELVTPGVSLSSSTIADSNNNFVASIFFGKKRVGLSLLDITTGEFFTASGDENYILKLLSSFKPKELLCQRYCYEKLLGMFGKRYYMFRLDEWAYSVDSCYKRLTSHFKTHSLKGFGIEDDADAISASGAVLQYLEMTEHKEVSHISNLQKIDEGEYVWLDHASISNLEILESTSSGGESLFSIINHTITPMGMRLMKQWLALPLNSAEGIMRRQLVVTHFVKEIDESFALRAEIGKIFDLERLISRASFGKSTPREMLQIARALCSVGAIKIVATNSKNKTVQGWANSLDECKELQKLITDTIVGDPPANTLKGGYIASGVNHELDQLRKIAFSGKEYLCKIQERESQETNIPSLKIGFNNVFGYYIEVRNIHKERVPDVWIRKQTLANAERYITPELKEYEEKILGAEERIFTIEADIYLALMEKVASYTKIIQKDSTVVAILDVLLSFAEIGRGGKYCAPIINDSNVLDIKQGRHPIIEATLPLGEEYIPNDVYLDNESQQIIIITGPNMSGKSAILRQTAIIAILAQCGAYVPAKSAVIGVVDRIFTRVGASDNISRGESTFMVEMLESANILNNITDRSLVLLDEIGRGTSTYDGMSIAWAMVEFLHQNMGTRAKTLFATHYHELNDMEELYDRVQNYHVEIKEIGNSIIFLRKLSKGGTEHSFGIHVAKMAGMPTFVLNRADEILRELETQRKRGDTNNITATTTDAVKGGAFMKYKQEEQVESGVQLSLFQLDDPLVADIRNRLLNLDINNLTPMEALSKLSELKQLLR